MSKSKMIGYKAFDENWKCRDKKYEVGKTATHRGHVKLCSAGLHFVENPLDMWNYYPIIGSKFALVEAEDVSDEVENDSKRVAKKLHISAELNLPSVIKAGFEYIYDKAEKTKEGNATSGYGAHSATSGDDAHSATSGNRANSATSGYDAHSATSGNRAHSATSGNRANSATSGYDAHSATSGDDAHSATSGNRANSATSGNYAHSATSGNYAHSATSGNRANSATSGNRANSATSGDDAHSATSGNYAHSATSGNRANSATSGYGAHSATKTGNAIACAIGRKAKAKASKGSFIVLAEWYEGEEWTDAYPIAVKSAKVDGKKIKADQWYKLVNGEFVETDDSND